jgi:hypothetical protein
VLAFVVSEFFSPTNVRDDSADEICFCLVFGIHKIYTKTLAASASGVDSEDDGILCRFYDDSIVIRFLEIFAHAVQNESVVDGVASVVDWRVSVTNVVSEIALEILRYVADPKI